MEIAVANMTDNGSDNSARLDIPLDFHNTFGQSRDWNADILHNDARAGAE